MKCIVYNLDAPQDSPLAQEFFCGVNGEFFKGKTGEVVNLPEYAIEALNNACMTFMEKDRAGNTIEKKIPRFKVILLEAKKEEPTEPIQPPQLYICDVCGKEFTTPIALEGHKRSHK